MTAQLGKEQTCMCSSVVNVKDLKTKIADVIKPSPDSAGVVTSAKWTLSLSARCQHDSSDWEQTARLAVPDIKLSVTSRDNVCCNQIIGKGQQGGGWVRLTLASHSRHIPCASRPSGQAQTEALNSATWALQHDNDHYQQHGGTVCHYYWPTL